MRSSSEERLYAYPFDGYWKDVGTIDSLWEANLDMLNPKANLDLGDKTWRIYAKNTAQPPQYIADTAKVENSMVSAGCEIGGEVDYSVLFSNVTIEEGATVKYSIVMPGAVVKSGAVVQYAMLAENVTVESGAYIGECPEKTENLDAWGVAVIGGGVTVGKNAKVAPKIMCDNDVAEGESV